LSVQCRIGTRPSQTWNYGSLESWNFPKNCQGAPAWRSSF